MLSSSSAKEFIWEKRKYIGLEEGENGGRVHRDLLSLICFLSRPPAKVTSLTHAVLISGTGTYYGSSLGVQTKYVLVR